LLLREQHPKHDKGKCQGPSGVLEQGKCKRGFHGNMGEPTVSLMKITSIRATGRPKPGYAEWVSHWA